MKKTLLNQLSLICPICADKNIPDDNKPLELHEFDTRDDDIRSGVLLCQSCGHQFPIIDGIAIFTHGSGQTRFNDEILAGYYVQNHFRARVVETLDKQGRDWRKLDLTGFLSCSPRSDSYREILKLFSGRMVTDSVALDVGCSVGRLTFELGSQAKFAIGVDPSVVKIRLARQILQDGKVTIHTGERRISGIGGDSQSLTLDLSDLLNS